MRIYLQLNAIGYGDEQKNRCIFTVVTEDWAEWQALGGGLVEKEVIEPWGVWIYFRDPSGNLFCVSNCDIW
jgi:predicted enzyme related to lactoylglutathione lyase